MVDEERMKDQFPFPFPSFSLQQEKNEGERESWLTQSACRDTHTTIDVCFLLVANTQSSKKKRQ